MRFLPRLLPRRQGSRPSPPDAARGAAQNLALVTAFTVLMHLCSLCQLLVLTWGLAPERYGTFAFGLTLQSYLFLFSCLGVRPVTVREGIRYPDELDRILTAHLAITGSVSGLLLLIVLAGASLAPISTAERLLLGLLAAGNVASSVNLLPLFDVHHRQPRSARIALVSEFVALLFLVGLYRTGQLGLATAGVIFAGKWAANSAGHVWVYHGEVRPLRLAYDGATLRTILGSSWPLTCANLVATVPFSAGVFFVRAFHDEAGVALLALGQQAASAFLLLAALGIRVLQPHLAGLPSFRGSPLRRLTLLYSGFVGVVWLGAAGTAYLVVWKVLAPGYRDALGAVILLLGGALVQSFGLLAGACLIVRGEERLVLAANGCACLFYVPACWWVVPRQGPVGAAVVTGCAVGLATVLLVMRWYWSCRHDAPPSAGSSPP